MVLRSKMKRDKRRRLGASPRVVRRASKGDN